MDIKILGSGCSKCERLEIAARSAVTDLGIDAEFDKVTDPGEIASWGVMATPALVDRRRSRPLRTGSVRR